MTLLQKIKTLNWFDFINKIKDILYGVLDEVKNLITTDQLEAIEQANNPNSGNPFATINDITSVSTPDATTAIKGKIKLAGDLAGTADLPTIPALTLKQNISGSLLKTTISAIRSLSGTLLYDNFYTTDPGKEGNWYYDSTDTTTADNTGTVLVTSDGKRIKRVYNDFVNITWFGAIGDDATDNTIAVQSALNANGKVLVPKGNFIASNLIPNSKNTIYGTGESSVLKFKTGSTGYFLNCDTKDGILISELLIDGGNVINYTNTVTIGTRSGIYFNAANQNNKIHNCKIRGFNGIAVGYNGTTISINESVSIVDSNISYNYCGISTAPSGVNHDTAVSGGAGGEYSKIMDCTLNANRYAIVCSAGNTNVAGNNLSGNGYGIYSTSVSNVGHGNIVSNLINHSSVYALYMQSNIYSSVISNNAFYSGNIYFDGSTGIIFNGNQLSVSSITILGTGYHNFSNNFYYIEPIYTGDLTNSIFSNNYGAGGFLNNSSLVTDAAIRYDNAYNIINNVVVNGDFSVDASWTKGAGWTISGGKANSTASSNLSQTMSFINGTYYVVEFDVSNFTSGIVRVGIGGLSLSNNIQGNGHKKLLIQKPSSGGDSNFYINSVSFTASIDNVVIYPLSDKKLTVDNGVIIPSETANTITSFDVNKGLKSLPLATYPSLTELSFVKGVTSSIQTQLSGKAEALNSNLTGITNAVQYKVSALNAAPSTSTDTGTTGEIRITAGFIYVCIATNTWVRTALTTW